MLPGAGLGDHAWFAHALGQQCLTDHVVDLVRTGVIQVFTLKVNLCAAHFVGPATRMINRAGPTDKVLQLVMKFTQKLRVVDIARIRLFKLFERMGERLGNKAAAIRAKMAGRIGKVVMAGGVLVAKVCGIVVHADLF